MKPKRNLDKNEKNTNKKTKERKSIWLRIESRVEKLGNITGDEKYKIEQNVVAYEYRFKLHEEEKT